MMDIEVKGKQNTHSPQMPLTSCYICEYFILHSRRALKRTGTKALKCNVQLAFSADLQCSARSLGPHAKRVTFKTYDKRSSNVLPRRIF
eukprot:1187572-Prorocentrum_minimum.AAC.3